MRKTGSGGPLSVGPHRIGLLARVLVHRSRLGRGLGGRAWNASGADERRRLLEAALTAVCEMLEPRGRFAGREAIFERISGFSDRFPGDTVDITTNVDEHKIDIVERAADESSEGW